MKILEDFQKDLQETFEKFLEAISERFPKRSSEGCSLRCPEESHGGFLIENSRGFSECILGEFSEASLRECPVGNSRRISKYYSERI